MGGLCLYSAGYFKLILHTQNLLLTIVPTENSMYKQVAILTGFLLPLDPSATLLTIVDAEENAFVSTHIKENDLITKNVWLGLAQSSKGKK